MLTAAVGLISEDLAGKIEDLAIDPEGEKEDQAVKDAEGNETLALEGNTTLALKGPPGKAQLTQEAAGVDVNKVLKEVEVGQQREYVPSKEDIGYRLKFVWIPVTIMGVRGEIVEYISTIPVMPGTPAVDDVGVARISKDDATLIGKGTYVGGEEGESLYVWKRQYKSGRKEIVRGANDRTYNPERQDIGCCMIFGMIPVRCDGVRGPTFFSPPSDTVARCPPSYRGTAIIGEKIEGRMLYFDGKFIGGEEEPYLHCNETRYWLSATSQSEAQKYIWRYW